MERTVCKYHQNPPIWHCNDCGAYFCSQCVPGSAANYPKKKPRCILCQGFLVFEGGTHTAEPFWKRAGDFFRYPLHKNLVPLLPIVMFYSFLDDNWISWVVYFFLRVIEVRYCLLVIEECIKGNLIPPKFTKILDDDGGGILLGFFLIVLFYSVAPYALTTFSQTAGEIMYFIMPIIFPASIILLAATRQSLTALNPIAIMSLISSIGAPYLLVCFLTEALFNFPDYIRYLIKDSITGFFHDAITNSLDAYFSLVVSALLGYAVYQYQKELGYVSISDDEYHLDVNTFEKKKELSTIKILAHEARYKEARDLLLSAINKDHENIELNDLLHRLLITTGDLESLSIHTLNCIEFLISKGYTGKAASYYLDTQHKIASFQLDKPDTSVKVAEALFEQGKFKETLFLLKDLHKRFPEYGFMFNAYFLVARAYAEGLHDKDNALKMLDYLSSKFLKNPRIPELESYRMRLMSL